MDCPVPMPEATPGSRPSARRERGCASTAARHRTGVVMGDALARGARLTRTRLRRAGNRTSPGTTRPPACVRCVHGFERGAVMRRRVPFAGALPLTHASRSKRAYTIRFPNLWNAGPPPLTR